MCLKRIWGFSKNGLVYSLKSIFQNGLRDFYIVFSSICGTVVKQIMGQRLLGTEKWAPGPIEDQGSQAVFFFFFKKKNAYPG